MPETDFESAMKSLHDLEKYLETLETFVSPKGEPLDAGIPLETDKVPTPAQVWDVLRSTIGNLGQVVMDVQRAFRGHEEEIRRLKNHRHNAAVNYTGKPEL